MLSTNIHLFSNYQVFVNKKISNLRISNPILLKALKDLKLRNAKFVENDLVATKNNSIFVT